MIALAIIRFWAVGRSATSQNFPIYLTRAHSDLCRETFADALVCMGIPAWIGISDPFNSGKRENWRDAKNKKPIFIKSRVKFINEILFCPRWFDYLTSDTHFDYYFST